MFKDNALHSVLNSLVVRRVKKAGILFAPNIASIINIAPSFVSFTKVYSTCWMFFFPICNLVAHIVCCDQINVTINRHSLYTTRLEITEIHSHGEVPVEMILVQVEVLGSLKVSVITGIVSIPFSLEPIGSSAFIGIGLVPTPACPCRAYPRREHDEHERHHLQPLPRSAALLSCCLSDLWSTFLSFGKAQTRLALLSLNRNIHIHDF